MASTKDGTNKSWQETFRDDFEKVKLNQVQVCGIPHVQANCTEPQLKSTSRLSRVSVFGLNFLSSVLRVVNSEELRLP